MFYSEDITKDGNGYVDTYKTPSAGLLCNIDFSFTAAMAFLYKHHNEHENVNITIIK